MLNSLDSPSDLQLVKFIFQGFWDISKALTSNGVTATLMFNSISDSWSEPSVCLSLCFFFFLGEDH